MMAKNVTYFSKSQYNDDQKNTKFCSFDQNHNTMVIMKISIFNFVLKITLLRWPKIS